MAVAGSEAGALSRRVPGAWGKSPSQDKVLPPKGCSREMGSWDETCLGAAAPKKQGSSACLGTVKADDHDIGIMVLQATGFPPHRHPSIPMAPFTALLTKQCSYSTFWYWPHFLLLSWKTCFLCSEPVSSLITATTEPRTPHQGQLLYLILIGHHLV